MTTVASPAIVIPTADAAEAAVVDAVARIGPLDAAAMAVARQHLDDLTKPPGSLGRIEGLAIDLAGITGIAAPTVDRRTIVVAAADHGIAHHGVSAYPSEVTAQMVANFWPVARPSTRWPARSGRTSSSWTSASPTRSRATPRGRVHRAPATWPRVSATGRRTSVREPR